MKSPILSRLLTNKKQYQSIVEELKINVNTAISYILNIKCENKTLNISDEEIIISWIDKFNGFYQQETLEKIYLQGDTIMLLIDDDVEIPFDLLDIEQQIYLAETIFAMTNE